MKEQPKISMIEPLLVKESKEPEPLPIDTETEKNIRETAGKPVYITVTYLDEDGKLQHFQKLDRGFKPEDILLSLIALGEDANRNLVQPTAILRIREDDDG